jgi:hypothetical protein
MEKNIFESSMLLQCLVALFFVSAIIVSYYFILKKINVILVKYWVHFILFSLTTHGISRFEYYILGMKYHIELPIYISGWIYTLALLGSLILIITLIRYVVLFFIYVLKKYDG